MIRVHIESLVLDGLPLTRSDGEAVGEAVRAELARLFTEAGPGAFGPVGAAVPTVRVGPIGLARGMTPAEVGGRVATAVYGGMTR